jgi:8-oxo-dGTP diphosphatase
MKVVTAALIQRSGEWLLARRGTGQHLEDFWEFPGLNLVVKASEIFTESIFSYENGKIKLVAIHALLVSGDLRLSVHDRVEWLKPTEMIKLRLAPADIPIAQNLMRIYGN